MFQRYPQPFFALSDKPAVSCDYGFVALGKSRGQVPRLADSEARLLRLFLDRKFAVQTGSIAIASAAKRSLVLVVVSEFILETPSHRDYAAGGAGP
jgi:hypothetical protein